MSLKVYLSGEIHTNWRDEIKKGIKERGIDIVFTSAITDHEASDSAGDHLNNNNSKESDEVNSFWRDHRSAKVNVIRTKTLIEQADIAVIRFGEKYKQWNAAFDAGYCAALGKPYITLHAEDIIHPLKEVDASAQAWATTTEQVINTLVYISHDQ